MAIPDDAIIQQSLFFTQQGKRWSNVIHWRLDGDLTNANEVANLNELQTECWNAYTQSMADAVQFLGSVWTLPLLPVFGSRSTPAIGLFGDLPNPPSQTTSYFIIRKYATPLTARGRGRNLIAGWPEIFTESNRITSANALLIGEIVNLLRDTFAATDASFVPSVFSRVNQVGQDVFKTALDPIARSLHSRQASGGL